MFELPERIIIFDTEYTSWKGNNEHGWNAILGEHKEIVHIGAVRADAATWRELGSLSVFVRPQKNPLLSDYFVSLTGITREILVAEGMDFAMALKKFSDFAGEDLLYSFGNDEEELEGNCRLLGIPFLLDRGRFHDIKDIFEGEGVPIREYTSGTVMRAFGKEPLWAPHNALNDARSILDGLRELASVVAKKSL